MTDATKAAEQLRSAISQAMASGITRQEIFAMVSTAQPPGVTTDTIYSEAPAGLISLRDAARKYGVRNNTLNVAMHRGMLTSAGKVKGRGGRGGFNHLVSEEALRHYLKLPPGEDAPRAAIRVISTEADYAR